MTRAYEIVEITEDREAMLAALQRYIERRNTRQPVDAVVAEADTPTDFDRYRIGERYGRYHEQIVRREVRRSGVPAWFDPRFTPGQFGLIGTDGMRCYIEVLIDDERRNVTSTFDTEIVSLVERSPEQTTLF
jgi:hypothetical protein